MAGLLEGDGHISLPSMGVTTLDRVLNPRIIFTSHVNNLGIYAYIQSKLGGIGRFQSNGDKLIRYIIGDMQGIVAIVNMLNGKLRTPKNQRLNDLINFINVKYSLSITNSLLDSSNLGSNSWFSGFTEADGHFGLKIIEGSLKSDTRKRSISESISLRFVLNQRSYDKPNKSSMLPIMQDISYFLSSNIKSYLVKPNLNEVLTISVQSINKLEFIVYYFNRYPLIGTKAKDFKYWEKVYNMMLDKEHLTDKGKSEIRLIADLLKNNRK